MSVISVFRMLNKCLVWFDFESWELYLKIILNVAFGFTLSMFLRDYTTWEYHFLGVYIQNIYSYSL